MTHRKTKSNSHALTNSFAIMTSSMADVNLTSCFVICLVTMHLHSNFFLKFELRKTRKKIRVIPLFFTLAEVVIVAANQCIYQYHGLDVVNVECDIGLKRTLRLIHCCATFTISIIICININCAGISDHCVVTMSLLVGAGALLFGFIQTCEAYAPQTAEYLRNM